MDIACHICKSNCPQQVSMGDGEKLDCPRCGEYSITGTAAVMWPANNPSERQVANASGWIREHQNIVIGSDEIDNLLNVSPPNVADRAIKLLLHMEEKSQNLGTYFNIRNDKAHEWLGVSFSTDASELAYLFNTYLVQEMGFLNADNLLPNLVLHRGTISPKGYSFLDTFRHSPALSQIGFCAMWFKPELATIWTEAVSPAIKDAGYDPKRIDRHHHHNKIDDEIIAMIRRSKFIVADFTGQRGGVYFEAGFAIGLRLPVIWTCEKSELKDVHFDNRQYNFIRWENEKLPDFKQALQSRIEATLGHGTMV